MSREFRRVSGGDGGVSGLYACRLWSATVLNVVVELERSVSVAVIDLMCSVLFWDVNQGHGV